MEKTRSYRNVFGQMGIPQEQIERRLEEIKNTFFFEEEERVYYPVGEDMAYIMDTGNNDARTEGMSYGMMLCVQLDMKDEFDRLWKWAKTYMWMEEGENEGYFAWSCSTDGKKNAYGPAPDGEEYFAMALFFASHRWGDGEGIFAYDREARDILKACLHKGKGGRAGCPMWNPENYQILFVPGADFTDPSYHLPHFYELFSLWADPRDRNFWKEAAAASRKYLAAACHPVTGMSAEYAEFNGRPVTNAPWSKQRHDWFFSDSYRTVANIGLDYEWFGKDQGQRAAAKRLQYCLGVTRKERPFGVFEVDGTPVEHIALHPVAITATTAQGTLAVPERLDSQESGEAGRLARMWVERFWNQPMQTGKYRYYDNCLYFFAFLALSGRYRIW